MKLTKAKIIIAALTLSLGLFLTTNFLIAANNGTFGQIEKGLVNTSQSAGYPDSAKPGQTGLNEIIGTIINRVLEVLGVVFMILMLYGGYLWLSAQGNDSQVEKGKKVIIEAIIGLAIVLGARIIVESLISANPVNIMTDV